MKAPAGGSRRAATAALAAALVVVGGCGSDDKPAVSSVTQPTAQANPAGENACPVEGCSITITDATREGDELKLTWAANFKPAESRNHIHVYWDIYRAEQVSNDAAKRGVVQGEWVPTDAYPTFVTGGAVSVTKRASSTTVCVTAGDGDHNVIDPKITNCRSVAGLL